MYQMDLQKQLAEAEKNRQRVIEESEQADRAVRLLEEQIYKVEKTATEPAIDDILAGKKPKTSSTQIEELTAKLEDAKEASRLYSLAVKAASQRVEEIQNEIETNRREIERAAFCSEIERWDKALNALLDAHGAIEAKLANFQEGVVLNDIFFPSLNPGGADWRSERVRCSQIDLFNTGRRLYHSRTKGWLKLYDRKNEVVATKGGR